MHLMIQYIRRHLGMFLTAIFFLTAETFADLLQPTLMSYIVDRGIQSGETARILRYGAIMLVIAAAGAFGAVMRNIYATRTSQLIAKEMRLDIYRKVQTLSFENIDRLQPASIITRITNDVTQVQNFITGIMRIMLKAPVTCIGAVFLIIVQMPEMLPLMLVILLAAAGLIFGNMKLGYPRFGRMQRKLDQLNRVSREFLSAVRVVKAFRAEQQEEQKFGQASEELAEAGISSMRVLALFGPLINLTVNFGIVAMLWISGTRVNGEIGRLMACVNYMTQVLFALGMVSHILNSAVRAAASSERIQEIFHEVPAQKDAGELRETLGKSGKELWETSGKSENELRETGSGSGPEALDGTADNGICGSLRFEHVSFAYAGSAAPALTDVSVAAETGEVIGIIGPTGSGKTTLVNLAGRFYDAVEGRVTIDGRDVREIPGQSLRRAIAVVPQKALLFSGSILENLLWGDKNASMEQVEAAAKAACADEFIGRLPEQYDTQLGQGGVNLSGGQKQRLSLARALLKRPRILILDDCTSALDAATEAAVLEGIRRETSDMTVLLVSQRIAAVMRADRILCLENGRVMGFGSHAELLGNCSAYRAVYESQIGPAEAEMQRAETESAGSDEMQRREAESAGLDEMNRRDTDSSASVEAQRTDTDSSAAVARYRKAGERHE